METKTEEIVYILRTTDSENSKFAILRFNFENHRSEILNYLSIILYNFENHWKRKKIFNRSIGNRILNYCNLLKISWKILQAWDASIEILGTIERKLKILELFGNSVQS